MAHDAYFQGNPVRLDVSRSKMHAAPRWTGTWTIGRLVPIFATSSILPGDTFKMSVSSAIRMIRPVVPVMDDMDITIEAYFVPHRLILSRKSMSPDLNDSNHSWSAFIGAQDSLLNMPTPGDIKLPCVSVGYSPNDYLVGGVADCLGYHRPSGKNAFPNCLKLLAYYSVWNEYWREPNTRSPVTYSITAGTFDETDAYVTLFGTDAGITANVPGGSARTALVSDIPCAPVSRYHGYFGSALPWPQRNTSQVVMPLGDVAPVIAKGNTVADVHLMTANASNGILWGITGSSGGADLIAGSEVLLTYNGSQVSHSSTLDGSTSPKSQYSNLFADLSQATAATVNQFRLAVQTQRWYEALARCGNKYSDLVNGMFGVRGPSIPDRPEYLGGFTAPINISQVASTNGASGGSIGETGAFSLSNPGGYLFTKSFTEHGTLIIVACCRVRESFSQGSQREDYRFDRFDFYWTQYANLGEQPVYKRELYQTGFVTNLADKAVFGYQEAWAEYRMFNDQVVGYMNPGVTGNLGAYTYANNFVSPPDLKGYLDATGQQGNVDRTLSVNAATAGFSLFGQFQFQIEMVRPMPTYSIPGLVDHH